MARKELHIEDITILIDSREQRPLEFFYGPADAQKKVRTEIIGLNTGDYSIKGFEQTEISIERKSLPDILGCIGHDRDRFEREIERLRAFPCRLIAIEASWDEIQMGQWRSKLTPKQVMGSIQGWNALGIPFFFHHDRRVLSEYIRNMMFIHARRCFEKLTYMIPHLKIES